MIRHPAAPEDREVDSRRPNLFNASLAVGAVAVGFARIPLGIAYRLPGMERLAREGAAVQARLRSRLEGIVDEILDTPEAERVVQRAIGGQLPDAVVRSLLEHRVVERIAAEVVATAELDVTIDAALEAEATQRLVQSVLESPGLERVLVMATDRALRGPEMQRVIQHVAASPEVRAAVTQQGTTLADELVTGVRTRAEALDDAAERTVRGWLRRPRTA
jgi:hypothetical protein